MKNGMYDRELREAIKTLKRIAKNKNYAAAIILVSETHAEFRIHFPTWSALTLKGQELRIRSKLKEYDSIDHQRRVMVNSIHILCQIRDIAFYIAEHFQKLIEMLEKKFQIVHKPYQDFYPDYEDDD